jgi:rfaE bifunctional protein nucleotidyltransferase chain/domain
MDKLNLVSKKILSGENLIRTIAMWRFKNSRIVFTNGCFDLLHRGHVEYLARAASYGDILIVGLNSDASVRRIKGNSRPVQDEEARALVLASLQFVTAVVLFGEDTPYNLIRQVEPDVLVKGADYKPEDIVGFDIVSAKGGQIVTVELVKGYSTTGILNKISKS